MKPTKANFNLRTTDLLSVCLLNDTFTSA